MRVWIFILLLIFSTASMADHQFVECTEKEQLTLNSSALLALMHIRAATQATDSHTFKIWFGDTDPEYVIHVFDQMHMALRRGVKFNCDENRAGPLVYASVQQSVPFVINIGGLFWAAPVEGFDTKFGVIIHELSHFFEVGATRDLADSQWGSRTLVQGNGCMTTFNANSYEYFAESIAIEQFVFPIYFNPYPKGYPKLTLGPIIDILLLKENMTNE